MWTHIWFSRDVYLRTDCDLFCDIIQSALVYRPFSGSNLPFCLGLFKIKLLIQYAINNNIFNSQNHLTSIAAQIILKFRNFDQKSTQRWKFKSALTLFCNLLLKMLLCKSSWLQCDRTVKLFIENLALYANGNLPNRIKLPI